MGTTAYGATIVAYGYIRFSSDEQADGDSERRQFAGIAAMAAQRGFRLIMLPPDRAVSAYEGNNLRHGSLAQFIEDARAGRIARGSWLLFEGFDGSPALRCRSREKRCSHSSTLG